MRESLFRFVMDQNFTNAECGTNEWAAAPYPYGEGLTMGRLELSLVWVWVDVRVRV